MGGRSSKVKDDYVLRTDDNGQESSQSLVVKPSVITSPSSSARRGSITSNSNSNSNNGSSLLTNDVKVSSSSSPSLTPPPKLSRRNSLSNLDRSSKIDPMKFTNTSNKLSLKPSIVPGGKANSSSRCPWLMKNGVITAASLQNMEIGRVIGTGLMGTVRFVKMKNSNYHIALKSIKKDYIERHRDHRHIDNERNILNLLKSTFCIKLFGTFQDNTNIYFALELAAGGELFRRLSKKEYFKPPTAKFYASEIFSALEHVQALGYVYRDLKPENVMLDEDGHCKLVDFGFATQPDSEGLIHTICGTPAYLSPEQLNGKFTNGYGKIVDWWSFGVFIFELLTGKTPFCKNNRETSYAIYLRILKSKVSFPTWFDSQSKDLITKLCHADVSKRLSDPESIKAHDYFEISWDLVKARRLIPPFVPRLNADPDDHYFDSYGNTDFAAPDSAWSFEGF